MFFISVSIVKVFNLLCMPMVFAEYKKNSGSHAREEILCYLANNILHNYYR